MSYDKEHAHHRAVSDVQQNGAGQMGWLWFGILAALLSALVLVPAGAFTKGEPTGSDPDVTSKRYTMSMGGYDREYLVYAPSACNEAKACPLIVALHPGASTASNMEKITRFDQLADANGFIVAYPNGIGRGWNAGTCCGEPMKKNVDDIAFIRAVVGEIQSRYKIDASRMYVTGFSNGGFMTHYIACKAPDLFAAYASVEGTLMTDPGACRGTKPTPFLVIHGRSDPRVFYNGGTFDGTFRMSVADQVAMLAGRNHCSNEETVTRSNSPVVCKTRSGCGDNEVSYCALEGVGHQWAGGPTYLTFMLGKNTDRFRASDEIWSFFHRHQRAAAARD
jgi:polyhydroxybutyrate depolymerase